MRKAIMACGLTAAILLCGCSSKKKAVSAYDNMSKQGVETVRPDAVAVEPTGTKNMQMIPKATVFRMSGDYADNVAVTLDSNGELAYYPAPSDLKSSSAPLEIADGWYLNRQGLGPNSVFTKYTFAQYRALKQAPTPEEIKAAIIPGAVVTEFSQLPLNINQVSGMTPAELKEYLK